MNNLLMGYMHGPGFFNYGSGTSGWWWMIVAAILHLVIIIGIIYFISRLFKKDNNGSAMNILKSRYANGEITEEEYKKKSKMIK